MNCDRTLLFNKVNGFRRAWSIPSFSWNEPGMVHVPLDGYNAAVGSTFETIWDFATTRVMLAITGETTLGVSSSDANDTSAGSGTKTVRVWGINSSYQLVSEDFSMSGQTKVVGIVPMARVFRTQQLTGAMNAGIIYVYTSSVTPTAGVPASGIHDAMTAGLNKSSASLFTVPAGKTLALLGWHGGNSAGAAQMRIRVSDLVNEITWTAKTAGVAAASAFYQEFTVPFLIPQKHDVWVEGLSASASVQAVTLDAVLF